MKILPISLLLCGVVFLRVVQADDAALTKLLVSSPWCASPLLKSANFLKLKYFSTGTYTIESWSNSQFCEDGSSSSQKEDTSGYGTWKIENGVLYATNESGKLQQVDSDIKSGNFATKAFVLDGMEYVKCE